MARADAARLAALQVAVEGGSGAAADAPATATPAATSPAALTRHVPRAFLASRPMADWETDVSSASRAVAGLGPDGAARAFLAALRALPYGGSLFFDVSVRDDPVGLVPAKALLGVNARGIHFFRRSPQVGVEGGRGGGRRAGGRAARAPGPCALLERHPTPCITPAGTRALGGP